MKDTISCLTLYEAWDYRDGGGIIQAGYYSTNERALIAGKGKGWGDGSVAIHKGIRVDGKIYLLVSAEPIVLDYNAAEDLKRIAEEALKKLSKTERLALKTSGLL
jgi:hypothetical protein